MKYVIEDILMFCEKFKFRINFHYVYVMNDTKRACQDLREVKYVSCIPIMTHLLEFGYGM